MLIQLDLIAIILLSGLGVCFLLQMVYLLFILSKPLSYQKKSMGKNLDFYEAEFPVSIIICSKNESQNLARFLPSVLEQDYPHYEVIVVNDGSTDESEEILGTLEKQYNHLYRTYIPQEARYLSRKKLAMTVGIKAAQSDVLLFTEACCEPVSKDWIKSMCRHYSEGKTIILGFSPLMKSSSFSTKFAVYDNFINGLQYLSLAILKHPYRGVGRNMSYIKSHFFECKGFSKYLHLEAGEDDLFINQIAESENVALDISPESFTITHLENFSMWEEIRLCQSTTQRYYRFGPVLFWRVESWSRFLFLGLTIGAIVYGLPSLLLPAIAFSFFLIRLITQLLVINKSARSLHTEKFYFTLPLFDLFQPFFDLYISLRRLIRGKKDYTWR